jgi:hypothetical protein
MELTAGTGKGMKIIQVEVPGDRDCHTSKGQYGYRKIKTVEVESAKVHKCLEERTGSSSMPQRSHSC